MIDPVTGSLIVAGIAGASQAGSAVSQGNQNRKNRKFAVERYNVERDNAKKDWDMQNTYNSPQQQMARLQQAGLNPNMVYGNGSAVNQAPEPNQSHTAPYRGEAPQVDLSAPVQGYFDTQMQQVQLSNQAKQGTLLDAEYALKEAQKLNIEAETLTKNHNNDYLFGSSESRVALIKAQLARANAGVIQDNWRLNTYNPLQADAVRRDNANRTLKGSNLQADTRSKTLMANLQEAGISPNDPAWMRMITQFIQGDKKIPTPKEFKDMVNKRLFKNK